MPWCSGKVTVPFGCSTALVMNRRPGHAPQPPPAVDALAGMAAALAEMAIAMSAVRPSAILMNLILRNLVIFTGCPFLWRGHQPGRRPKAPRCFAHLVGVAAAWGLTSSRRTHRSAAANITAARSREGLGANRSEFAGRQASADVVSGCGDRPGMTAISDTSRGVLARVSAPRRAPRPAA